MTDLLACDPNTRRDHTSGPEEREWNELPALFARRLLAALSVIGACGP
jgi:hypothetical protein